MSQPITTCQLTANRVEQAWPLMREVAGAASLDDWLQYAMAMLPPIDASAERRGILVAERRRTIRGLVCFETSSDVAQGRVLRLCNAVILDLALSEAIARKLYESCVEVAREADCAALHLEVSPQMAWIGDSWKKEAAATRSLPVIVATRELDFADDARTDPTIVPAVRI